MMKKVLKIVGLLVLAGIGSGVFWYFQSLKIEGDPLLTACWPVDLYDDVTGEKVVGVEDLDFDPETGTIFMSAYDRRAVAREIEEGTVTTQGGIYTLNVSDISDASTLKVTDISQEEKLKEGFFSEGFRPHGIAFAQIEEKPALVIINRMIDNNQYFTTIFPDEDFEPTWVISIDVFFVSPEGLILDERSEAEGLCNPNDVVFWDKEIYATESNFLCEWGNRNRVREILHTTNFSDKYERNFIAGDYYNGIQDWGDKGLVVSDSFGKSILFVQFEYEEMVANNQTYVIKRDKVIEELALPIAPDNLTIDENNNLYVAGFPNLINHYFYMKGWFMVRQSPSAAYRISPEDYSQELLFKDNGTMISGATVALRAGDYLVMGSAWDDHIAICSGMDGLD